MIVDMAESPRLTAFLLGRFCRSSDAAPLREADLYERKESATK
jgi:hypothetical protein